MKKHKKIFLWFVGVLGFLLFLFTIFLFVLPSFINIEPIRERILANLSKEVGGKVTYQKVDISFLPLPRMVVHNVGLSIPGKTQGTIQAVVVYPKIGALLKGRVELSGLVLASPRFRIDLPERTPGEGHAPEKASPLLVPFSLDLPVEDLALEQGKLEIFREGQRLFVLQNIEAQLESQDKGISLDLSCASNVVERFSLKGRFDPETFKGRGQIDLVRIKPHLLTQAFLQDKGFRLGQSLANLKLNMVVNGPQAMTGKFQGSIPSLILIQGERQLSVEAGEITGSFQKAKEKTTVSLDNLSLDQPQATLAATLVLGKVTPLMALKVEGKEVDVHSIRKAALEFLGDDETVQEIFEIVRGGHLPSITFETRGDIGDDLGDLQNMVIKGRIEQGKIRVPGVDMDLVEVTGDMVISQGILKGENLAARDGKTLGREGKLELGLEGDDAPFHLDILVDTDLAMLPSLLKKVVDNRALIKELGLIKDLSGKATGRLVLGDRMNAMIPRVDVSPFNLSAKYGRLPFGITVKGGRLVYDQTGIRLDKVKVDIGKSSVSGLSGRVNLGKTPNMDITYKGSRVNLGELFPWLRTQEWWHVNPRDLKSVEGFLSSSGAHINGPLLSPEKWQITVNGKMQDIVLDSELIPGPMKVSEGNFRVVQRAADQKLTVEGVHIGILDSSFQVSGVLSDYLEGLNRLEMSMQGTVDKAVVRYLGSRFQVPPHLHLKTPISLSRSQFAWERGKQASFQGGGMIQGGPQFSMDLVEKPGELVIKYLRIHDEESQAEFGLDQKEDMIEVRFDGHLKKKTLNGLFVKQPLDWGEIKGDIQARIFLKQPLKSTAQGTLEGDDLIIQLGLKQPMRIRNISLNAQGRHIDVQSAGLQYQDQDLVLEGGLDFSGAGLKIDLDARTGDLDWEKLSAMIKEEQAGEGAEEGEARKDASRQMKVEGVVRFKAESFAYKQFTWKPMHADISLDSGGVRIDVKKADICGISTPGVLKVKGGEVSVDFRAVAENLPIEPAVKCLRGEQFRVTGTMDLQAEIRGKGKPEQLVQSLEGYLNYNARNGRIYRDIVITNVLSFLNITEILRGRLPDIGKEGFGYHSIDFKIEIKDGKMIIREGIIDGKPADIVCEGELNLVDKKMDLTVLVSPVKTANWIIRHTPIVRRIMGNTLITVPVKLKGSLENPEVHALPPEAVGGGLIGMMKRTVELPFDLIHANPSEEKK